MGRRGPNRKPAALHHLERTTLAKTRGHEPKPKRPIPPCPRWLDPVAQERFHLVARQLHELGVLAIVDEDALTTYSVTWSRWLEAEAALREDGQILETTSREGNARRYKHPAVSIASDLIAKLQRMHAAFGMTPGGRNNLSLPPKAPDDAASPFRHRIG